MKNVVYPDYDELFDDFDQLDHQEMAENISKLTKCLETLQRKIELFNSKTKEFIDKDLPKCCRKILSKKTTAKIVSCEISIFCETLISFVSFFKLPPKLLNCIANALREMWGQSSKFQPAKLTKNDKNT